MKTLKQWCIENQELELLKFYENAKNIKNSDEISYSSPKEVNWKCPVCKIEWKQSPNKMMHRKEKDCAYCTHKKPSYFYNLKTEYLLLAEEWDYDKNQKSPTEYLPKSKESVHWKCKNGHMWKSRIGDRVRTIQNSKNNSRPICPYCNHERASNVYNLVTEYPDIARQWNYVKNGSLKPIDCHPKGNQRVWWTCDYNSKHIWKDRIANRTLLHRGCKFCNREFKVSFPARVIYYYLYKIFPDCEIELKFGKKYRLDICIPSLKVAIEYDGWYHHTDEASAKREREKEEFLKERDYNLLHIKEQKKKTNKIIVNDNVITYHRKEQNENLDELVQTLIKFINEKYGLDKKIEVNWEKNYREIEQLYYHVRKANSFAVKYPKLLEEWSDKNTKLPDEVSPSNQTPTLWICSKCKKEFEATIYNRVRNNSNCPYCSNRKVCHENSLDYKFPEIAKDWDYEANGDLTPKDVTPGSDKTVHWICKKGHRWATKVYVRTGKSKGGCPYCSGARVSEENSLVVKSPELKKIWNYDKNEGLIPEMFSYQSNREVEWICEKGHEWRQAINLVQKIQNKQKCPICRKIKLHPSNSLKATNPELVKQWNYEKNGDKKPEDFLPSSLEKVWWICEKGHEWKTTIKSRNLGTGCPYCKGLKVTKESSLEKNKEHLVKEWNYEKNGDLTPKDVSTQSGKKVWWKCKEGHEWEDTISHRSNGRGCPYCSGRRVSDKNSLAINAKEIAKEWNHEKNGDLTPDKVSVGSAKKVWWKCEKGHEWQSSVYNRTKGEKCPKCWQIRRNKKRDKEKN